MWRYSRRITSLAASAHLGDLGLASVAALVEQDLNTTARRSFDSHHRLHRDPHHRQVVPDLVTVAGFEFELDFDSDSVGHKAPGHVSTGH